jgi:hypothetical protein
MIFEILSYVLRYCRELYQLALLVYFFVRVCGLGFRV